MHVAITLITVLTASPLPYARTLYIHHVSRGIYHFYRDLRTATCVIPSFLFPR